MCGRIGLPGLTYAQFVAWQRGDLNWDDIQRDGDDDFLAPSWNVKPTQDVEVLYLRENNLMSSTARWWFVPHWFKGDHAAWKQTTFNARIETAAEKPTYRTAWSNSRCLIPATGYYEWTGPKGQKQPWWITPKTNEPFFFFAGLMSQTPQGNTCTIVTRKGLPQIEHIHARTPVILRGDEVETWVQNQAVDIDSLGTSPQFDFHKVNKFGRDDHGPELIEPFVELI